MIPKAAVQYANLAQEKGYSVLAQQNFEQCAIQSDVEQNDSAVWRLLQIALVAEKSFLYIDGHLLIAVTTVRQRTEDQNWSSVYLN